MTEAKTKSDQTSLSLDLQINNSDLSSLVGPLDSNLTQLENFLNVEISRRGASFGVKGTQANCRKAIQALTDLAAIAERKSDELTAEDIQLYLVGQNAPVQELAAEEPVPTVRDFRDGRRCSEPTFATSCPMMSPSVSDRRAPARPTWPLQPLSALLKKAKSKELY